MANNDFFVVYKIEPQGFLSIMSNKNTTLVQGAFNSLKQLRQSTHTADVVDLFKSARCSNANAAEEDQYATAGFTGVHVDGVYTSFYLALRRPEKTGASCHLIGVVDGVVSRAENPDKDTVLEMEIPENGKTISGVISMTLDGVAFSRYDQKLGKSVPMMVAPLVVVDDSTVVGATILEAYQITVVESGAFTPEELQDLRVAVQPSDVFVTCRVLIERARDVALAAKANKHKPQPTAETSVSTPALPAPETEPDDSDVPSIHDAQ